MHGPIPSRCRGFAAFLLLAAAGGATALPAQPFSIQVDATALSAQVVSIPGVGSFTNGAPFTASLAQGSYTITYNANAPVAPSPTVAFSVDAAGLVAFDPALQGILDGAGTSTLVALGVATTVDPTGLDALALDFGALGGLFNASQSFRLLPGNHRIRYNTLAGFAAVDYAVDAAGTVSYDAGLEGILTGTGTAQLTVHGVALPVDLSLLSPDFVDVRALGSQPTDALVLDLLPGPHRIQYQTLAGTPSVDFSLAASGVVSYDPSFAVALSGQGTTALGVPGLPISVDLTALTVDFIGFRALGTRPTDVLAVRLLPGMHRLRYQSVASPLAFAKVDFDVAHGGTLAYDAGVSNLLTGAGTTSLGVEGAAITLAAQSSGAPTFGVSLVGSFASDVCQTLRLLPGIHEFDNGALSFPFDVLANETIAYDPSLEGTITGSGTGTLRFVNGSGVPDACAVSEILDAFNDAPETAGTAIGGIDDVAQTILVGASGTLSSLDFAVRRFDGITFGDVLLQIRDVTAGGLPGSTVLYSQTVPNQQIAATPAEFTRFDLSAAGLQVAAGDRIAVVVTPVSHSGSPFPIALNDDGYPDGAAYCCFNVVGNWVPFATVSTTRDVRFRLYLAGSNAAPTADAGDDVAVRAGDVVTLDGSGSFDDNTATANLAYAWSFAARPAGSLAVLTDDDTAAPSFTADLPGDYVVTLIVTDEQGLPSNPDMVTVSSDNLAPTADAGADVLVVTGIAVTLDGSDSSDPEGETLSFAWSVLSAPAGSTATIANPASVVTSFTPDVVGNYQLELVVADTLGAGTPDQVTITATDALSFAELQVVVAADAVAALLPSQVTTKGNQRALGNFLRQAIVALQQGDVQGAIDKLQKALARTDGCATYGAPDGNGSGRDWVIDCSAQAVIQAAIQAALDVL